MPVIWGTANSVIFSIIRKLTFIKMESRNQGHSQSASLLAHRKFVLRSNFLQSLGIYIQPYSSRQSISFCKIISLAPQADTYYNAGHVRGRFLVCVFYRLRTAAPSTRVRTYPHYTYVLRRAGD